MKKIWLLIGFLWILLSFSTYATCVWTWECNDTIDPSAVQTDEEIQFLLDFGLINATKEEAEKYWIEQIKAYYWAYENWITSMDSFKEANIEGELTRIEMAKMLSQYATHVVWRVPANIVVPKFSDITPELDETYNNWVTLAYQLWIMGIWIDEFRPFDRVTRAEFVTAIWRLLYKIKDWEDIYYSTHLETLHNLWIIQNTNPNIKELRWWVMIMLMRSAIDWNDPSYRVYETTPNFVWIVVDPNFYDDTSIVFVYNTNTSGLPINQWVEIKSVWYKRWDLLQIEFDGEIENTELWVTYAKIWEISSIKNLWNIKDYFFKKRNNIPYELQYSWYQEKPTIDYYVYQGETEWWVYVKNETWYTYTFNDLWIKISTPLGWRYQFPAADPYNLFVRNWVEIRKTWKDNIPPSWVEYIKIYSKWENESLEDVIKERHLNNGCLLESWVVAGWLKWSDGIWYYIINPIDDWIYSYTIRNVRCFPDDEDDYSIVNEALIQFFEPANDKWRYYKIKFQNYPSIFGKIETL